MIQSLQVSDLESATRQADLRPSPQPFPIDVPSSLPASAREGHKSPSIFDFLSLTQSSPSLSAPLLEDIDLDLQCDTGDVDNSVTNLAKANTSCFQFRDLETAEVYTLSKVKPNSSNALNVHEVELLRSGHKAGGNSVTISVTSNDLRLLPRTADSKFASRKILSDNGTCSSGLVRCSLCYIQFSSEQSLRSHIEDQHSVKHEFACSFCGKVLKEEESLKRHEKQHRKDLCASKSSVDSQSTTSCYSCTLCPHVSKTRRLLREHISVKHSKTRVTYSCSLCAFSCLKQQTLSLHMRRHEEEPKFACDQCGKLFLTMSILKRHANTHNKTHLFACAVPECGKTFNMKGRLTDHMRTVHKIHKTFRKTVRQEQNFTPSLAFMAKTHPQFVESSTGMEAKLQTLAPPDQMCLNTGLETTLSADVVIYDVILSEDQIQQFQRASLQCAAKKHCSDDRSQSQLSTPTDRREVKINFICCWAKCGKRFRDSFNLRMHMFTHTGEMQRACSLCRYRCVQKSALDSHMAKHLKQRQAAAAATAVV